MQVREKRLALKTPQPGIQIAYRLPADQPGDRIQQGTSHSPVELFGRPWAADADDHVKTLLLGESGNRNQIRRSMLAIGVIPCNIGTTAAPESGLERCAVASIASVTQ